jgi:hypothetical protein
MLVVLTGKAGRRDWKKVEEEEGAKKMPSSPSTPTPLLPFHRRRRPHPPGEAREASKKEERFFFGCRRGRKEGRPLRTKQGFLTPTIGNGNLATFVLSANQTRVCLDGENLGQNCLYPWSPFMNRSRRCNSSGNSCFILSLSPISRMTRVREADGGDGQDGEDDGQRSSANVSKMLELKEK